MVSLREDNLVFHWMLQLVLLSSEMLKLVSKLEIRLG